MAGLYLSFLGFAISSEAAFAPLAEVGLQGHTLVASE